MSLLLLLGAFFILLVGGVPVAFSMITATILVVLVRHDIDTSVIASQLYNGINLWTLLAVPLFLLAGNLMNEGGVTQKVVDAVQAVVGRLPGGLAFAAIGVNVIMGGMSGSDIADATATGTTLLPALKQAGYPPPFSAGLIGAGAAVGPLVPPSISLILFGLVANVSISQLFVAGLVPALVLIVALIVYVAVTAVRSKFPREQRLSASQVTRRLAFGVPGLLLPAIVIGGILGGIFTPIEAGAVASVVAAIIGGAVYRGLNWRRAWMALETSARDSAAILFVVGAASLFGLVLTLYGASSELTNALISISPNWWVFLIYLNIALLVLGAIFETTPVIVLVVPLLVPAVQHFHISLVLFGIVCIFNLMIGMILPPGGITMYILCRLANIRIGEFLRGAAPVLAVMGVVLVILTYVQAISLTLPRILHTP